MKTNSMKTTGANGSRNTLEGCAGSAMKLGISGTKDAHKPRPNRLTLLPTLSHEAFEQITLAFCPNRNA